MPTPAYVAQFRRHYPGLYESPRYRTRDGVIPFGAFWIYLREIPVHLAVERVSQMRAVLNAIALAFAKEHAQMPKSVQQDLATARLDR